MSLSVTEARRRVTRAAPKRHDSATDRTEAPSPNARGSGHGRAQSGWGGYPQPTTPCRDTVSRGSPRGVVGSREAPRPGDRLQLAAADLRACRHAEPSRRGTGDLRCWPTAGRTEHSGWPSSSVPSGCSSTCLHRFCDRGTVCRPCEKDHERSGRLPRETLRSSRLPHLRSLVNDPAVAALSVCVADVWCPNGACVAPLHPDGPPPDTCDTWKRHGPILSEFWIGRLAPEPPPFSSAPSSARARVRGRLRYRHGGRNVGSIL